MARSISRKKLLAVVGGVEDLYGEVPDIAEEQPSFPEEQPSFPEEQASFPEEQSYTSPVNVSDTASLEGPSDNGWQLGADAVNQSAPSGWSQTGTLEQEITQQPDFGGGTSRGEWPSDNGWQLGADAVNQSAPSQQPVSGYEGGTMEGLQPSGFVQGVGQEGTTVDANPPSREKHLTPTLDPRDLAFAAAHPVWGAVGGGATASALFEEQLKSAAPARALGIRAAGALPAAAVGIGMVIDYYEHGLPNNGGERASVFSANVLNTGFGIVPGASAVIERGTDYVFGSNYYANRDGTYPSIAESALDDLRSYRDVAALNPLNPAGLFTALSDPNNSVVNLARTGFGYADSAARSGLDWLRGRRG